MTLLVSDAERREMDIAPETIGDTELAQLVRRFAQAHVLILGDVMLDRYVSGTASRLSPEAPIPVLRPTARRATLGGAANVALNIATLGGQASLVGVIGDDSEGSELTNLLGSSGIVPAPDCCTGTADHGQDPLYGRHPSIAAAGRGKHCGGRCSHG